MTLPSNALPVKTNVERSGVVQAVLLTRPYSWLDASFTVLLGLAWAGTPSMVWEHVLVALVGLLLWFSLNWVSERIQRDPGRVPVPWLVSLTPIVVALAIAYNLGSPSVLIPAVIFTIFVFLYPLKAIRGWLGPFGPAMRGIETAMLFWLGFAMADGSDPSMVMLAALGFIQASRSLLADIRDIHSDKFELPQIIGAAWAKKVVLLLLLLGIGMLYVEEVSWPILAILVVQFGCIFIAATTASYGLHMLFIATFACVKAAIYFELVGLHAGSVGLMAAVGALQFVLISTYWLVPRRANSEFAEWVRRKMRLVNNSGNDSPHLPR